MEEDVDYRLAASCYEGRKMSRSVTNQGDVVVPRPTLGGAGGVIQVMDGAGDTGKKSGGDRNGKSDLGADLPDIFSSCPKLSQI